MADPSGPAEVITLGEALAALVATAPGPLAEATTFERHVAGAEANVAVGVARLGRRVAFIGRVGTDGFGTAVLRRLRGEGVDVAGLTIDAEASTGLLVRERRALGPAEVLYHRAGSAGSRLTPDDIDAARAKIEAARWLHITGITPALSRTARAAVDRAVEIGHDAGLTVSLDLNVRRKLWGETAAMPVLRELARQSDIVLASVDEAEVVTGVRADGDLRVLAEALLELGPSVAVLKLGTKGAFALERGGRPVQRSGLAVPTLLDPVGAGDAFSAGFIVARLEGADLERALDVANACGAAAVAAVGDLTGLPEPSELARLLGAPTDDTIR